MPQLDFNQLLNGEFVPSSEEDWEVLRAAASNLFKPKTPIDDDKLFAGRLAQIKQVLDAVYEDGGHAVIFGERGVGKTSLAKIIEKKIAPVIGSIRVPEPVSCGRTDDFYTIWGNALNDFAVGDKTPAQHFRERANPYEIYNVLIDLFGRHESIARCCEQIKMPRMSEGELRDIITDRLFRINFSIDTSVERKIVKLSQGLPGYVHLLGQLALKEAIDRRSRIVEDRDFRGALAQALEKADFETRNDYYLAVSSAAKDNKYKEVLLACAMAESNELGYFFAGSLRAPYSLIRGKAMDIPNYATNLNNLCSDERGPALIKTGKPKRFQYRFRNPLLQPLTIMMGVNEGLITLD